MKTILKLCISPCSGTQGGIYRHQGRGGARGQTLAQSAAAAAAVRPRKRGYGRIFAAIG